MTNGIKELLEASHQIILTGAPGTGKTFLAKKIACSLVGCETWEEAVKVGLVEFCQFHPSYSYADFVEGLRPISQGGAIGFERKDGVFKEFCVRALKNLQESEKSQDILDKETRAREMIDEFLNDSLDNERELKTSNSSKFFIERVENEKIYIKIPENEKTFSLTLPYGEILKIVSESINLLKVGDIREVFGRVNHRQQDSYVFSICKAIKQNVQNRANSNQESTNTSEAIGKKNFVFIIDEINRGDVSKIFGELFYAIDPGYRGVDGRVMTQYDNLIEEGDPYYGGFYVPKNVYIIGTMNDIDRSVESMDFAIRRRFTWYEVTADARKDMLNDIQDDDLRKKAMARMQNINKLIAAADSDLELGAAYQIGPAYFLKLKDMSGDNKEKFDTLWKLHIEPLLKEYLRGQTEIPEKIEKLKEAYNNDNSQRQQAVARNEAAQQTSDDEGAAAVDHAANG